MSEALWDAICRSLPGSFYPRSIRPCGGGCIHDARVLDDGTRRYFVKVDSSGEPGMLRAEAEGLEELRARSAFRVPEVVGLGEASGRSWLALEHIDLRPGGGAEGSRLMGEALARMHRAGSPTFGWKRDSFLGSSPQPNPRTDDWVGFLREHRLAFQFGRAARSGRKFPGSGRLLENLGWWFRDYAPVPSLLHGDLWHGNAGFTPRGEPCVFDPAVHYGDREAEFGIIGMFGGFDRAFHQAYQRVWPPDPGFGKRKGLYLLYHQLNHFNIFGGGYASSAQSTLDSLLRALDGS